MPVIDDLSPTERLALIGELWDSLDKTQVPVSRAQMDEIDRRLAMAKSNGDGGVTWDEFKAELTRRFG